MFRIILPLIILCLIFESCYQKSNGTKMRYSANDSKIEYFGRIDFANPEKPILSGPGSYFKFGFKGPSCEIFLRDQHLFDQRNYIIIEMDGKYFKRFALDSTKKSYMIADSLPDTQHTMLVCKATEAGIGYVEFSGIICHELVSLGKKNSHLIEYIGNSITCGMGLDNSENPCNSAQWYDQHNAYLSYGPLTARSLNACLLYTSPSPRD